jgi:hypothetical protein
MPVLLIRRISAYDGPDILLGVFASEEEAERCRQEYFRSRSHSPFADPWYKQAYRPDGLKESDLVVRSVQGASVAVGRPAFVVSGYSNGFGQTVREFCSVHVDSAIARRQAARLQEQDGETDSWPSYFSVQEAIVGQLLSDDPDAQPGWYE